MTRRRLQLALAGGFFAVLVVADALSFDLFASLSITTLVLLTLYVLVRPQLASRALRWTRVHTRPSLILVSGGVALLVLTAFASDQIRHPTVTAAQQADDWTAANSALAQIVAADLHWQAAGAADRGAKVGELQTATRRFDDAVNLLERIRPPEEGLHAHRATTAVYREMADILDLLPGVRANGDTAGATTIWTTAGTLSDEAATFVELTTPR